MIPPVIIFLNFNLSISSIISFILFHWPFLMNLLNYFNMKTNLYCSPSRIIHSKYIIRVCRIIQFSIIFLFSTSSFLDCHLLYFTRHLVFHGQEHIHKSHTFPSLLYILFNLVKFFHHQFVYVYVFQRNMRLYHRRSTIKPLFLKMLLHEPRTI